MLDTKGEKLWKRIGVNELLRDRVDEAEEAASRASASSAYSSARWEQAYKNKEETTPASVSLLEQPPFAPPSMPLRQDWQAEEQLLIAQEESRFEQVPRAGQEGWERSLELGELEDSRQPPSALPESVTPLVYSKNSRKEEVRFSKQTAKAIILKIRLAEAKDLLRGVRADFLDFLVRVREEQEGLQREVCAKWFQLQREQSMRVQESVFIHQQDCQQLRYELEVLRGKEELMRCPVDSELIDNAPAHQFRIENEDLRSQLARLDEENGRLTREGENFKRKIGEIEAKTLEVRQSNDKLYEYIFDLEQKVAYYQEEISKMSLRAREETQLLERELEEATTAHYEEMNRSVEQVEQLEAEAGRLREDVKRSNELIVQFEKENSEVRMRLERLEEETKARQQEIETKARENSALETENKRLKSDLQRLGKERDEVEQWKEEQRRESNSRLSRAYSIKEDKKLIETLEIEKLVLQKENIQLKATIEFHCKSQNYMPSSNQNYSTSNQNFVPANLPLQKTYSMPYDASLNIQGQQQFEQKDKELVELKERELISLQNYLEDEARRLDSKQRDIESEYILKKEARREYVQPVRLSTIDDYGMKKLPISQPKPVQQARRNHFCSSQTQAIIEKVKQRQKMRENGCVCINQTRNCHCDAHSRGSRTSQDSNSRDYLRMQQHRPSNYSPHNYEYLKREQKSSKMKLIEDKVRRLKSELKNSFTTMGS